MIRKKKKKNSTLLGFLVVAVVLSAVVVVVSGKSVFDVSFLCWLVVVGFGLRTLDEGPAGSWFARARASLGSRVLGRLCMSAARPGTRRRHTSATSGSAMCWHAARTAS